MAIWLVWFPINVICKNLHTHIRSYTEVFQKPMYVQYVVLHICLSSLFASQELEAPVATVKSNKQKLEAGRYWDMDKIKPK